MSAIIIYNCPHIFRICIENRFVGICIKIDRICHNQLFGNVAFLLSNVFPIENILHLGADFISGNMVHFAPNQSEIGQNEPDASVKYCLYLRRYAAKYHTTDNNQLFV